jgi:leucine dehydrogenase
VIDSIDLPASDHEQVVYYRHPASGLREIIAIHNTALGPALGGVRLWPYGSEDEALTDVLRLSRGMTYKSAVAGLSLGGGKAVIIGEPTVKSEALFRNFGRFVDSLEGRYIAAEDVGTAVEDMDIIARETRYVSGRRGQSGDPSPATAFGVFQGLRAAVRRRLGRSDLVGVKVAVQGLGHVGQALCALLAEAGARLVVADVNFLRVQRAMQRFGAAAVAPSLIHAADVDVFAPCALGGGLNDRTIPALNAKVVAGAANNQLGEARHGALLAERGILYAPDYVINAGGIINISYERGGYDRARAYAHIARIAGTLDAIFARADSEKAPTSVIADRMAEQIVAAAGAARAARTGRAPTEYRAAS